MKYDKLVHTLFGQTHQLHELFLGKGVFFGRSLNFNNPAASGQYEIGVGLGIGVFGIIEIQNRIIVKYPARHGGNMIGQRHDRQKSLVLQTRDRLVQGHIGAGDRGRAGAAIGLDYVAVDGDLALAEGLHIGHGAQGTPNQALDFHRAARLLAGGGLAPHARSGGPGQHAVFGGDPARSLALQKRRDTFFQTGGAQHVGVAEFHETGSLGMPGKSDFQDDRSHLIDSSARWAHGATFLDGGLRRCGRRLRRLRPVPPMPIDPGRTAFYMKAMNDCVPAKISALAERPRDVFRQIVEAYLETGEAVGSRTLARNLPMAVSPATIRNVMSDLEHMGLLYSPHTSAGRLPTEAGLRLFVDGMLEIGDVTARDRGKIEAAARAAGQSYEDVLDRSAGLLSGLSHCASLVAVSKQDAGLKQIEFVRLSPTQALAVLVSTDGAVENRVMELPANLPMSALTEAANYLNVRLSGRTLAEIRRLITQEVEASRAELDAVSARVVEAGLAVWAGGDNSENEEAGTLLVRGQANLLEDVTALEDLERIRLLIEQLEGQSEMLQLLDRAHSGEGVCVFIGSENRLFSMSGSSMIVAPYMNSDQKVVGAIGVIGPTRLNYARIVPMVDFTARTISRVLSMD